MLEIPEFTIFAISTQISENSLIWSPLIWSTHCNRLFQEEERKKLEAYKLEKERLKKEKVESFAWLFQN